MLLGSERKNKKRHYLRVNKRGFISMYALLILSIFLAFTTMFAQSIYTFASTHTYEKSEFIDIHILKEVQKELKRRKEEKEKEQESENMDTKIEEIGDEDASEKPKEDRKYSVYKGCDIEYLYEDTQILVNYQCVSDRHDILISYDQDKNTILKYAYP